MFSAEYILDADDATLASGLALAKQICGLIESAWMLMKPHPEFGPVSPEAIEQFAMAFENLDPHPLGNGMLELWMQEMPGYVRSGNWERINDHSVVMAYNAAWMGRGMMNLEQIRRMRAGWVAKSGQEIRF